MLLRLCLILLAPSYTEAERYKINELVQQYETGRVVREKAIEAGLTQLDAAELTFALMRSFVYPPRREYVAHFESLDFDLFAFLKKVIELEGLPVGQTLDPNDPPDVSQLTVINWIAVCDAPGSSEWLIKYLQNCTKHPIATKEDMMRICYLLDAIGLDGSDKALDVLFRIQSNETWELDPPFQFQRDDTSPDSIVAEILSIRHHAATGIAKSGTDRALYAFATGEGIADDMMGMSESYFRTAAHARLGMYNLPWHYRRGLEPKVEEQLKAIYEKYGMEYLAKDMYAPKSDR